MKNRENAERLSVYSRVRQRTDSDDIAPRAPRSGAVNHLSNQTNIAYHILFQISP